MSKEQPAFPTYDAALKLCKLITSSKPLNDIDKKIAVCLAAQPRESIPLSPEHPLVVKFKEMFQEMFKPYYYKTSCEFLCAKVLPPGDKKHQVVTCEDCRKQCNAVFCLECFDSEKHFGHNYDRQFVKGGICDCGDSTKWNIDTFCHKHSFMQDINECTLTPTQMEKFKQDSQHLFKVLCYFYEQYLNFKDISENDYQNIMNTQGLKSICDIFGDFLFQHLTMVNQNRFMMKRLTTEMLSTSFSPKQLSCFTKCISLSKDIPLKKMLLAFIDLPKTSTKCSKLIILLLYRNQELRKEFTIDFIQAYSNIPGFATSSYRDLSPQLLSNSLLMSQLVRDAQMPKFALKFNEQWPEGYQSIQLKAKEVNQQYCSFVTDMIYLVSLSQECAVVFWKHAFEEGLIIDMASYTTAFSTDTIAMGFFNDQYYDLQPRFLLKFIRVLNILSKDDFTHSKILKNIIPALFNKIVTSQARGSNDLLFTYERMWAITVYSFLLSTNKQSHFNKIEQSQIIDLYKYLRPQSLLDAQKKVRLMFERLLQYFVKIDCLIYKKEDQINWETFQHAYFNWNNILSSIDAIYFRILLRLGQYIQKKSGLKSTNDHLDMFVQMINKQLKSLSDNIKESFQSQDKRSGESKKRMEVTLGSLLSFSSRLQQVIYSSLPDLCLSCKFPSISKRTHYKESYQRYYANLVRSLGRNERLNIETFTKLARFLLFEQDEVLKAFIQNLQTKTITNKSCSGDRINFHYFHSLKLKLLDFQLPSLKTPLHSDLFIDFATIGSGLLSWTSIFLTVSYWFERFVKSYEVNDYWSLFSNNLIQALLTLSKSSRTFNQPSKTPLIQQFFEKLQILHFSSTKFIEFLPSDMRKYLCQLKPQLKASLKPQSEQQNISSDDDQSDGQIKKRYGDYEYHDFSPPIRKIKTHLSPHYQLMVQELKLCTFCNGQGESNLYQFCFVSQTQFPPVLGIQQGQHVLAFTSCNHYSHFDCFKNFEKKNNKSECPECRSAFNILLPPIKIIEKWKEQSQFKENIYRKIKKAIKNTRSSGLSRQFLGGKIFRAILLFLALISSAKHPSGILKDNLNTYKRLFHLISRELKVTNMQPNHFQNNISNYLVTTLNRQQKVPLLTHLFQALAINLNPKIKFQDFDKNFNELPSIIQDFIGTIFQRLIEGQGQKTKPFVDKGLNELSLIPLDNVLESLYAKHSGSCPCSPGKKKEVFYLCLLHKKPEEICKFCDSCHLFNMRKHIDEHHKGRGEAICVRTDNGDIFYFNVQDEKYRVLNLPSIYTNTIEQKYSLRERKRQKRQFSLNQAHYSKLCQDFYTGRFKINSNLMEVKQS